jgi:hypothetical protein
MNARRLSLYVIALAIAAGGCAFVPKANDRLEEVRASYAAARADEPLSRLAPAELQRAIETFQLAESAWNALDDPAVVDHLAYLAKQRLAIARETALRAAAERAAAAAKAS